MDKIKKGVVVFATKDTKEGRADARGWLKSKGIAPHQARLFVLEGMVLVETLEPVFIPLTAQCVDN